jgi:hypothetical protein
MEYQNENNIMLMKRSENVTKINENTIKIKGKYN